jgi:hypothetical protein
MAARVPEPADAPDEFKASGDGWAGNFPNDVLRGEVLERGELETEKFGGSTAPVLKIADADNNGREVDLPCWRAHLRQLVEEHDPQPGDGIAVTYHGQEPGGLRQLYSMRVAKAGE